MAIAPNSGGTTANVGIGTTTPGSSLDVIGNGNFTGQVVASSFSTLSDYRIKENILPLNNTFTIDNLIPVTYKNLKTEKQDIGLIAHEVEEYYPCLVTGVKDGKEYQSVNYISLIPVLIKEIQELKKEIKLLKEKI
jgi:hypothetical protein